MQLVEGKPIKTGLMADYMDEITLDVEPSISLKCTEQLFS